jgi:hypothetical protein
MRVTSVPVAPLAPIFTVEAVGPDGFAWLYGPLLLHEALEISEYLEREALPGREPRISVALDAPRRYLNER